MSLDGLRAWIGEVERKLDMRTRVFLVLTVIAIGIGGAAIYLAIDARDSSVSENDVQALQERLEAQSGTGGGGAAAEITQLKAELRTLQSEVAGLKGASGESESGKGKSDGGGVSSSGSGGGSAEPSPGTAGAGANAGATGGAASAAKLQELLEQTKDQNEQAEEEEADR